MKNPAIYETKVLIERYIEIFFADFTSLFFLILQPIATGLCVGMVWQNTTGSPTLYFVLLFSSIFFGCINSCREIVKEKNIFERERISGLRISSYILSKFFVLSILGFAQILIFFITIRLNLTLDGNTFLTLLSLYLSLVCGTSLGLAISASVTTDVMALSLVPVFLIPQLLFSKLIMPNKSLTGMTEIVEKTTIVKWGYDFLEQATTKEIDWNIVITSFFILIFMITFLNILSAFILKIKEIKF
ncbi:MAG: ABC transporter permease [Cyanobacteriota bacterium]